eukprot:CAMPEP_0172302942 /NCGR_PEP_ID=MMETSP1058-20130122/4580_1 /TAXON_ID=83371 /ORGANISM="Detonula confervacea, Strain CCMP 353" /LENGTH=441 /DNA_ID=CAMNT_0013013611 /DNA_START=86 /DNA_END=1411 /DNA_ORIENTATION=-
MTAERNGVALCTVSRYTVPCIVCSGDILPGDRMFCSAGGGRPQPSPSSILSSAASDEIDVATIEGNNDNNAITVKKTKNTAKSIVWGHESCFNPNLPPPPPCRHWKRLGRCPAKEMAMCAFLHDDDERGTSTSLDKQRWGGKRHFVRNQHKNSVFRIFLMQTYGMDYMINNDAARDGVILDVAGGKGELSFELVNLTGAKDCVVVDPRPLNLGLVEAKWEKGLFEPKRTGVFSKWYPACEEGCKDRKPRSPRHLRCFFDSGSFLEFVNAKECSEIERTNVQFGNEMERAKRIVWTAKGLQHEDGASYNEENAHDGDSTAAQQSGSDRKDSINNEETNTKSETIVDPTEARSILQKCHLMVGFHPDQAAGEIIEFAMTQNIPWCIVPCCVYSNTFSQRKLKDGTKVTSYDHLVRWLCERDPRARTATLDLEGKNTVVYTLPI